MSTAAAEAGPSPKGKKKLLVIIVAAVAVLVLAAGGALLMMKKSASAEDVEDADAEQAPAKAVKHDPKSAPTFVPLDPFTVNLADRDTERYAQVGITLEVADAKVGDQIKAYMPAIRNNVLMVLADKTAVELMDRQGKARLAEQVRRETSRAMGYEVPEPMAVEDEAGTKPKKTKKKQAAAPELPVTGVHFSNFIIQ